MNIQTILKNLSIMTAFIFIVSISNAETIGYVKQTSNLILTDTTSLSNHNPITESDAYKLLYENAKENNDRIVTTIQWVIGISLAFLLAILGSQIFFNWKINKNEIDYIKKDIEEKMLTLKAELTSSIDVKGKEIQNAIDKKISEAEMQLKTDIKDKFESRIKFFSYKSDATEERIDKEVKQLKIELEKNSGDIWLLKGIESNALSSYLRTAKLQIELKREAKYILNDIISILSKLEDIHDLDYRNLNELINCLDSTYQTQKDKITSLYKNKPVYRFSERRSPFGLGTGLNKFDLGGLSGLSGKEYIRNTPGK